MGKSLCLLSISILLLAGWSLGQGAVSLPSKSSVNWTEFHTLDMMRWNPYETVLGVSNVGSLRKRGSYNTGGQVSSPAVVDGAIYFGSFDSNVYAVSARTGSLLWSYATGSLVYGSPAVAKGVVYVGSYGDLPCSCAIYGLNASTGAPVWSYATSYPAGSPAVANDVVFVELATFGLDAFDASSGVLLWTFNNGFTGSSAPAVANGVVYVGSDYPDNRVYALDAKTGVSLWVYSTEGAVGSPAVANGVVYVGSGDGNLYALNATTGAPLWRYGTGNIASPAVANGVVYVGSEDDNVYALNASTGAMLWSYTAGGYVRSSPAVANGVVYVGSDDDNVYALDASTGAMLWSYGIGSTVTSSPAVVNGTVYIGSDDGTGYSFGLPRGPERQHPNLDRPASAPQMAVPE